jgi:hypothetical protein
LELRARLRFVTANRISGANARSSGCGDRIQQPRGFAPGFGGETAEQSTVLSLDVCYDSAIAL